MLCSTLFLVTFMFVFETQPRMGLLCVSRTAQRKNINTTELRKQCALEVHRIEKRCTKQRNSKKA